jgi:hypothetical protein
MIGNRGIFLGNPVLDAVAVLTICANQKPLGSEQDVVLLRVIGDLAIA